MAFWAENPNFFTAIEQITQTRTRYSDGTINYAALGGRAADYPAIRTYLVDAYSRVLDDALTPKEALDEAAAKANADLEAYNLLISQE